MDFRHHFVKLPGELILKIFEDLEREDLLALRVTSRDISELSTPECARRYFTRPRIMLTQHSLEAFEAMSMHPIFAHHIEELHFASVRIHKASIDYTAYVADRLDGSDNHEKAQKAKDEAQSCMDLYCEMKRLKEDSATLELFIRSLYLLKQYGKPLNIVIMRNSIKEFIGFNKLHENSLNWRWECCADTMIKMLITAVSRLDHTINDLKVLVKDIISPGPLQMLPTETTEEVKEVPEIDANMLSAVSELTNLVIHPLGLGREEDSVPCLTRILAQATKIRTFHYHRDDNLDRIRTIRSKSVDSSNEVLGSCLSHVLEDVRLHGMGFSQERILQLLYNNKNTICKLEIVNCLLSDGDWRNVLVEIQKYLHNLQDLSIGILCRPLEVSELGYLMRSWFHPLYSHYKFVSEPRINRHQDRNTRQDDRPFKRFMEPWLETLHPLDQKDFYYPLPDNPDRLHFKNKDDVQEGLRLFLEHHDPTPP